MKLSEVRRTVVTPFWAMLRKDMRLAYRNPVIFGLLIATPFLLIAVLSEAFSPLFEGRETFDVPVIDLAGSPESARLIADLDGLDSLRLKPVSWEESSIDGEDAARLMGGRDVAVLVVSETDEPRRTAVTLFTDPFQPGFAAVVRDTIASRLTIAGISADISESLAGATGDSLEETSDAVEGVLRDNTAATGLTVEPAAASNERIVPSRFEQTVPGFSVMFTFWLATFVAASIYMEKKEYRTWRRTLASPAKSWTIVASRVVAYVLLGLGQMLTMFLLGGIFFGIDIGWNLPVLAAVFTALALVTTAFGFMMISLIRDMALLSMVMSLLIITMAALGGALVPASFLPGWAETLSVLTPHYWAMDAIQEVIVVGNGLPSVGAQIGALLLFAAVFFFIGSLRFRIAD